MVFWYLDKPSDIFWMVPIMGFFQLSVFAGYAIYFPELFPTHLRARARRFVITSGGSWRHSDHLLFGVLTSKVFRAKIIPTLNRIVMPE